MSYVPSSGLSILVDAPRDPQTPHKSVTTGSELVSWLVGKFQPWEQHRNDGYQKRWSEYWRMWRGQWSEEDRNRLSERSRLIAPALSQAIEMTTSEIEEGLFSKDVWFDVSDDLEDQEKADAIAARDALLEDLSEAGAQDAVGEAVLNGAIFGTGVIKMNVEVVEDTAITQSPQGQSYAQKDERVLVYWESIRPDEFVPDPAGRHISEMLGCFHKVKKPKHYILDKIEKGVYRRDAAPFLAGGWQGSSDSEIDRNDPQAVLRGTDEGDEIEIIEYHGKVPVRFLHSASSQRVSRGLGGKVLVTQETSENPIDSILAASADEEMVEAIVTIANQGVLLRAMVNPFLMHDRSVIAFQFEKVPGRFWGRGVAEKGYNPQKALDAEMRARVDALGFVSAPMVAVDGGRMPRGFRLEVKPGKVWITQGPPAEVMAPVKIGNLEPSTFNQTQDLERMVQMATGAFDTASALKGGDANGPQAASLVMGAFVKRSKRAIRNVNDNLVQPLIRQTMWRYMQFSPRRYPQDYKFQVRAVLGIVAREVEAMQLTQLIGMMPEQFPQVNVAVAKGIVDLSSVHNKAEIMTAMEQAMAPPSPEQQKRAKELEDLQFLSVQAEAQGKVAETRKTLAETRKIIMEAMALQKQAAASDAQAQVELGRLVNEAKMVDVAFEQNDIDWARVFVEQARVRVENKKASQKTTTGK